MAIGVCLLDQVRSSMWRQLETKEVVRNYSDWQKVVGWTRRHNDSLVKKQNKRINQERNQLIHESVNYLIASCLADLAGGVAAAEWATPGGRASGWRRQVAWAAGGGQIFGVKAFRERIIDRRVAAFVIVDIRVRNAVSPSGIGSSSMLQLVHAWWMILASRSFQKRREGITVLSVFWCYACLSFQLFLSTHLQSMVHDSWGHEWHQEARTASLSHEPP